MNYLIIITPFSKLVVINLEKLINLIKLKNILKKKIIIISLIN